MEGNFIVARPTAPGEDNARIEILWGRPPRKEDLSPSGLLAAGLERVGKKVDSLTYGLKTARIERHYPAEPQHLASLGFEAKT